MALFLRCYRVITVILWFFLTGIFTLPFGIIKNWHTVKIVSKISRIWGAGVAKIMNMKIKVHGDISQFKGGLIVSNHMGYFDIIAHSSAFPIRFTPKVEILHWPLLGWYLALSHPIWIDRSSKQKSQKTMTAFKETMEHHIPLIVYPEGTSTSGQEGMLPFKSTPFEAAVRGNFPILPIVTVYNNKEVCWYDDTLLLPHVWKASGYPSIDVDIYVLPVIYPEGKDRKEIARHVHSVMEEEYWKIMKSRKLSENEDRMISKKQICEAA